MALSSLVHGRTPMDSNWCSRSHILSSSSIISACCSLTICATAHLLHLSSVVVVDFVSIVFISLICSV